MVLERRLLLQHCGAGSCEGGTLLQNGSGKGDAPGGVLVKGVQFLFKVFLRGCLSVVFTWVENDE